MEFDAMEDLGQPGWIELRLTGGEHPPRVLAKFEERAGRGVLTRLLIVDDDGLDATTLRALPFTRIESAVNHPEFGLAVGVFKPLNVSPKELQSLIERGHVFTKEFGAIDKALRSFFEKRPKPVPGIQVRRVQRPREPLGRPDGTDPASFYQRVARAYNSAVVETSKPAKVLADEAGVPVTTVHRWIREARMRGFLPPARKGRAG